MEQDGQTYLVPFPGFVRLILVAGGAFALVMAPYELWRGVWPMNVTSPFFGIIILGAVGVGAAAVVAGLFAPAVRLRFLPGMIEVTQTNPWGESSWLVRAGDIEAFTVEEHESSEGPTTWCAVIRWSGGRPIRSRELSSREAAERQLAEFKAALQPLDA